MDVKFRYAILIVWLVYRGQYMRNIQDTITLIQKLHVGQTDWEGNPYWHHPHSVMELLDANIMNLLDPEHQLDIRLAALLHDVLEDTHCTALDLMWLGYSNRCVTIVKLVTRFENEGLSYHDKIQKIVDSNDLGAMLVKLADNTHNTDHSRNSDVTLHKAQRLHHRYIKSMGMLKEGIRNLGYDV